MQTHKKIIEKSQIEFEVSLTIDEFKPYMEKGTKKLAQQVKIEGFRPGKVPYDILKQKVGEMAILEEAANIAIRSTIDEVLDKHLENEQLAGQPQVEIIKLAPNNDFVYKVKMPVLPKVKLGQYKDLNIKNEKVEIDEKELDKTLEQLKEMKAKESDKNGQAEIGDKLILDIFMFSGGVPVEGGEGQGATVILGKEYFIPGFDEKLIGAKVDETKEFTLAYPKEHHQKHLAGKNIDFKVKVKEIKQREVPKLDDSLAQALQFKSLNELKEAIKKNILVEKEKKEEMRKERDLMEKLIEKSDFEEMPEEIIKEEAKGMLEEMKRNIEAQGGKFADYLSHLKKTGDQILLDFMPDAVKRIKIALVLKEVGKKEKITVSEEEVEEKITELKKTYAGQAEAEKQINSLEYKKHLNHALLSDKIVKKLKEWNYADFGQK
jgi:trigger factor